MLQKYDKFYLSNFLESSKSNVGLPNDPTYGKLTSENKSIPAGLPCKIAKILVIWAYSTFHEPLS